jgi:hypothetical protein
MFKWRRTLVARRLAELKIRLATEKGGALHFAEKAAASRERFDRDYRDAVARLRATSDGLAAIFGYGVPLPPTVANSLASGGTMPSSHFDDTLKWVRDAISWLIAFGQSDEVHTETISLRYDLTHEAWKSGLNLLFC